MEIDLLRSLFRHITLKNIELEKENARLRELSASITSAPSIAPKQELLMSDSIQHVSKAYESLILDLLQKGAKPDTLLCFHSTLSEKHLDKVTAIVQESLASTRGFDSFEKMAKSVEADINSRFKLRKSSWAVLIKRIEEVSNFLEYDRFGFNYAVLLSRDFYIKIYVKEFFV